MPAACGAAVATAYLTAAQFYTSVQHLYGILPAIGVVGVVAIGGSVRSALSSSIEARIERQAGTIRELLEGLILTANEMTGCAVRQVSATYLVVSQDKDGEFLRVVRWTGLGGHAPSNVRFIRGKGVVGECWDAQQPQFVDLREFDAQMAGCDRALWDGSSDSRKHGLTYDEWRRLQSKHLTLVTACTHAVDEFGVEGGVSGVVALSFGSTDDMRAWRAPLVQAVLGAAHATTVALK